MAESTVNGSGNGARSGAQTLTLLATPLNVFILRALTEGPKRQVELRRESGSPAQSTLRSHLKGLVGIGAIARQRGDPFPGAVDHELTPVGRELLFVATTLERWLAGAPDEPLALGSDAAKAAIKALVESWSSTMLRALAAGPLALTQLDRLITSLNYPSLERRLTSMRLAGQVKPVPSDGQSTPYAVTDWLRRGIAPLAAASRWERRNLPDTTAPIGRIDAETAFLMAMPLVDPLPKRPDLSGSCRMAVEIPNGSEPIIAGVLVDVEEARIAGCSTRLQGHSDAWVSGSSNAWFRAAIEADPDHLEIGGDCRLARALLAGLFETLFGSKAPRNSHLR